MVFDHFLNLDFINPVIAHFVLYKICIQQCSNVFSKIQTNNNKISEKQICW